MSDRALIAAKRFIVKELTSYQDEVFGLLFRDASGFSRDISDTVFGQADRRISIYGVRGQGKTTAMQGALWTAFGDDSVERKMPVNIVVSGARNVEKSSQLSDLFYNALIVGVSRVAKASRLKDGFQRAASRYAPWVAKKMVETAGIFFGPISLASDLAEKGMKKLVDRLGYSNIDSLIASRNLDSQRAATLLVDSLNEEGWAPTFVIDELDKVEEDSVLSDFFDGNQAWFQGKQGIISLSYTFGESLGETLVTSARRISDVRKFPGIVSPEDAAEIIRRRISLGVSQIEKTENAANDLALKLMPDETIKAIINVSAPNAHIMLERTSQAIDQALKSKSPAVSPDHVYSEPKEAIRPTKLEALILKELGGGRLSPSKIADRLRKDRGLTSRTLGKMMSKEWVGRIGEGKLAYYYIAAKGEAAYRRAKS